MLILTNRLLTTKFAAVDASRKGTNNTLKILPDYISIYLTSVCDLANRITHFFPDRMKGSSAVKTHNSYFNNETEDILN